MRIALSLLIFFLAGAVLFGQQTPGRLIVVPPSIDYESVANRADLTELLAVLPDPPAELRGEARFRPDIWATDVRHVRDVWCLQFSFRPVRLVEVAIPNESGHFEMKTVWYLVYNVKNLGPSELDAEGIRAINSVLGSGVLEGDEMRLPVPGDVTLLNVPRAAPQEFRQQTGVFSPQPGDAVPIRFVPNFILATNRLVLGTIPEVNPETGVTEWHTEITGVAYLDQFIPLALLRIKERERMPNLETTVSIAERELAPGEDAWGVAMWTDIDPRINEFSIFVSGLTNAYRWENRDWEEGEMEGNIGEGQIIRRRVLKTDWWRVGDRHSLNEAQIRFGSRDAGMPESILDRQDRRMSPEERVVLDRAIQAADTNADGWVSPSERAVYHLLRQDWLKPTFGFEWIFL